MLKAAEADKDASGFKATREEMQAELLNGSGASVLPP